MYYGKLAVVSMNTALDEHMEFLIDGSGKFSGHR